MKTAIPSPEDIKREWHLIDAQGAVLGRIATKAAMLLMGKHKPMYTQFLDSIYVYDRWSFLSATTLELGFE